MFGQPLVLFLSQLLWRFHAELFVLNSESITYWDSFSLALMSLDISGSILMRFSDSSKTLMALMHSVLRRRTSLGCIVAGVPRWAILWVYPHRWWTGKLQTRVLWCTWWEGSWRPVWGSGLSDFSRQVCNMRRFSFSTHKWGGFGMLF